MPFTISPFTRPEIKDFYKAVNPNMGIGTFESYVYLTAEQVISKVWRKGIVDYVGFYYDTTNTYAGTFAFSQSEDIKFIHLNFANIKTYRDLAFSFLHEWRHALQYNSMGKKKFMKLTKELITNLREKGADASYLNHDLEADADQFAFEQENVMEYKNFPINPNVSTSVFVTRKRIRA